MKTKFIHNKRSKYYLINGFFPALIGFVMISGLMVISLGVVYFHYGLRIGLACFLIFGISLFYYLSNTGKIISLNQNGVSLYSLTQRCFIPWEEVYYSGCFYHYIYVGVKKKYFYFSKRPKGSIGNTLALNALPSIEKDFIYVMEQKGLQQAVSQYVTNRKHNTIDNDTQRPGVK